MTLAERIINLDFYGARDAGETPETIEKTIEKNPEIVIEWLLDYIDEMEVNG